MPLIPALGRLRHADLCKFKGSLIYTMNFRIDEATQTNLVLKKRKIVTGTIDTIFSHISVFGT